MIFKTWEKIKKLAGMSLFSVLASCAQIGKDTSPPRQASRKTLAELLLRVFLLKFREQEQLKNILFQAQDTALSMSSKNIMQMGRQEKEKKVS
jgi:hypothetical protein